MQLSEPTKPLLWTCQPWTSTNSTEARLAVPTFSIDVRCYEDDDQASDHSISSAGSSNQPRAAAHQRKSLASLLSSKLAKLPGFAGCVGYLSVKDANQCSFTSCSEQGGGAVLEGPVLPAQLQDMTMPTASRGAGGRLTGEVLQSFLVRRPLGRSLMLSC